MQPLVRAMTPTPVSMWLHRFHPLRLQYEMFSDVNPFMSLVKLAADQIRIDRKPAVADNPFIKLEETASRQIVAALDGWRQLNETMAEWVFLSVYGSPILQATVGVDPGDMRPQRKATKDPWHRQLVHSRIAELKTRITTGGLRECVVRGLLYAGMARGGPDERGLAAIRRLRAIQDGRRLTLAEFKALLREQFFMLIVDEEAALAAIPGMLPAEADVRQKGFAALCQVLSARGEITGEVATRLRRIAQLFEVDASLADQTPARAVGKVGIAKAS
jgi:hypothetical protein